jgi:hypothetical protein
MKRRGVIACIFAAASLSLPPRPAVAQPATADSSAASTGAAHAATTSCAGGGADSTAPLTLADRLDILHNLNTSKEVAQPAFAQYTRPDTGKASGSVSAAVKYQAFSSACVSFGPFAEYIWNNLTSKRVNTLRVGIDADWQVRPIGPSFSAGSPLVLGQINYRADREKHTKSAQAVAQFTWVSANQIWPAPNATWRPAGPAFDLVWSPLLGLVYDGIFEAADEEAEGGILRLAPQVDVVVYPAGILLDRRLELAYSFLYQYDVSDGTSEHDDRHTRRRATLSFFPIRDDNIAAGLSVMRNSGEDPTKGYANEQYWQFGITLRVK